MDMLLKIKQLANQKGITISELERRINLSNGQIGKWSRQTPGIDKVQKVADYFNVSVDYLLGREKPEEDLYEQQLVAMFRKQTDGMNDSQKEKFNKSLDKLFSVAEALLSDEDSWKGD
ncbi:helix-turn-helix transcriptional regulator [Gemella sp. 20925_1_85]|jgi:helix-turn-helix domain-containing protein|uniref:helix-turn-helix domain-containing protein n=1 Tax=Gemella sp. 20925_1_85 TaxID=3003690 RepID=UPI00352D29BD